MKVGPSNNPSLNNVQSKPDAKATEAKSANRADKLRQMSEIEKNTRSNAADGSANIAISSKGKERAEEAKKAFATASATPDVREDKIADLKKRIAEGSYKIDNEAVADKMISEHMSF